jgi:glutamyl-tRNA synthetase
LVARGLTAAKSAEAARHSYEVLADFPDFTVEGAEPPMRALVDELGMATCQVFGVFRVAITGQKVSPPLFESMEIIGKEKVLERIHQAVEIFDELVKAGL